MAGDLTQRIQFLRKKGIIGKRASDRRGLSTSDIFRMAREAGFEGGFQGQGISSRSGRTATPQTEVLKDPKQTIRVTRTVSQPIKTQAAPSQPQQVTGFFAAQDRLFPGEFDESVFTRTSPGFERKLREAEAKGAFGVPDRGKTGQDFTDFLVQQGLERGPPKVDPNRDFLQEKVAKVTTPLLAPLQTALTKVQEQARSQRKEVRGPVDVAGDFIFDISAGAARSTVRRAQDKPLEFAFDVGKDFAIGFAAGKAIKAAGVVATSPAVTRRLAKASFDFLGPKGVEPVIDVVKFLERARKPSTRTALSIFGGAALVGAGATQVALAPAEQRADVLGRNVVSLAAFSGGLGLSQRVPFFTGVRTPSDIPAVAAVRQRAFERRIAKLNKQRGFTGDIFSDQSRAIRELRAGAPAIQGKTQSLLEPTKFLATSKSERFILLDPIKGTARSRVTSPLTQKRFFESPRQVSLTRVAAKRSAAGPAGRLQGAIDRSTPTVLVRQDPLLTQGNAPKLITGKLRTQFRIDALGQGKQARLAKFGIKPGVQVVDIPKGRDPFALVTATSSRSVGPVKVFQSAKAARVKPITVAKSFQILAQQQAVPGPRPSLEAPISLVAKRNQRFFGLFPKQAAKKATAQKSVLDSLTGPAFKRATITLQGTKKKSKQKQDTALAKVVSSAKVQQKKSRTSLRSASALQSITKQELALVPKVALVESPIRTAPTRTRFSATPPPLPPSFIPPLDFPRFKKPKKKKKKKKKRGVLGSLFSPSLVGIEEFRQTGFAESKLPEFQIGPGVRPVAGLSKKQTTKLKKLLNIV